jgi:hypothetical protein
MKVNIDQWAKMNNLTPEEFKKEVFTMAAALGAMDLDGRGADSDEAMKFTCSDSVGEIELYVCRA